MVPVNTPVSTPVSSNSHLKVYSKTKESKLSANPVLPNLKTSNAKGRLVFGSYFVLGCTPSKVIFKSKVSSLTSVWRLFLISKIFELSIRK